MSEKPAKNGTALHAGVAQSVTHSALRFGGGGGGGAPRGLRRGVGAGPLDYIHSKHYFRGCSCVFRKRERNDARQILPSVLA